MDGDALAQSFSVVHLTIVLGWMKDQIGRIISTVLHVTTGH